MTRTRWKGSLSAMSDVPAHPSPATPREIALEQLFVQFVGMGPNRKYGSLSKANGGIPTAELIRHAGKFLWRERIVVIHSEANDRTREELVETIAEINSRHITQLKVMQEKAFEFLKGVVLDKPADGIKLLTLCIKMEREAVGLDQNSETARLSDLLATKMEQLLEVTPTKKADVVSIEPEYPDPDEFDPSILAEPEMPE